MNESPFFKRKVVKGDVFKNVKKLFSKIDLTNFLKWLKIKLRTRNACLYLGM